MVFQNKRGYALIEAIASIFIISTVIIGAISIIINVRVNTIATQSRLVATQVGSLVRDEVIHDSSYNAVSTWMASQEKILTSLNCATSGSPYSCDLFAHVASGITYDQIIITFLVPTVQSVEYKIIHFTIYIEYYSTRHVLLEGIIYEQA